MYIQYEWDTGKQEGIRYPCPGNGFPLFSCRIIIVDHRLNTCCAFLPFDLESVKVCPSGSKFGRKPEKHRKMYYAYISSNGKGMYNMKDVQNAIYSIVETRGKDCYCILCHAIDVAIAYQPNMPKMQVICNEVRIRTGKRTNEAVSRALNRAAKDIWQNGRRRELRAYCIEDPPTAKELISLISAKLWADRQG